MWRGGAVALMRWHKILAEITAWWCSGKKILKVAHVTVVRTKKKWRAPSTAREPGIEYEDTYCRTMKPCLVRAREPGVEHEGHLEP